MELKIISYPCSKNRCYIKGQRRTPIGIQMHSIGCAQGTAKSVADYWNSPDVSALVTYMCDSDEPGRVYYTLPESCYSWADAGFGNRNLITIECCESDFMKYDPNSANYVITDEKQFKADILKSYNTAVLLAADICKRYGWDPMAKLSNGLHLISSHDEGRRMGLSSAHVDTSHIWPKINKSMDTFREEVRAVMSGKQITTPTQIKWYRVRKTWTDADSQLNAYEIKENAINNCPFGYAVYDSEGNEIYRNNTKQSGTQASEFSGLTETQAANKMLNLVRECDDSGILYSMTTAQMILESGYGKTDLAKAANNFFGMKCSLSNNNWSGSTWDGVSKVNLPTWEVYNGKSVRIKADFRAYVNAEQSVKDHAAYLLGAWNGSVKRYAGLTNAKNYREAITIVKNGGYATDPDYISKICSIIQRFGLDKYDKEVTNKDSKVDPPYVPVKEKRTVYRVQIGMYDSLDLAKKYSNKVSEITGYQTGVELTKKGYQATCGSFESQTYAMSRRHSLIDDYKIDAIVAETEIEI